MASEKNYSSLYEIREEKQSVKNGGFARERDIYLAGYNFSGSLVPACTPATVKSDV
jgi:hypothetical protein